MSPPRWFARNVAAVLNGAGGAADLAALHDTDPEREGFVPARLSAAALRAAFVPLLPTFEAAPLWVYGHSFTPIPGYYCTQNGGEWSSRLKRRLGFLSVQDYGINGSLMEDMAGQVNGTHGGRFPVGTRSVVVLECEINNAISEAAAGTAAASAGFANALRAILARISAASVIECDDASVVATGTWGIGNFGGNYSGNGVRYSTTVGDKLAFPVTGDTCYAGTVCLPTSDTGSITYSVNGQTVGAWTQGGKMASVAGNLVTTDMPGVVKITGMNAAAGTSGGKTLTATVSAVTSNAYVGPVLLPSATPPPIIVCKDPHPGPFTSSANQTAWAANSPGLHAIIDSVTAEFPNAHVVDLDQGWDPSTMAALTDPARFHPNDVGMDRLATTIGGAITTAVAKFDPGVVKL